MAKKLSAEERQRRISEGLKLSWAFRKMSHNWSRWYYGVTHLVVQRGDSQDVATINRFPDGSCTLFMYNTKMKDIWTNDSYVTYHENYLDAMKIAEKRYGVNAERPAFGLPSNHPNNPQE